MDYAPLDKIKYKYVTHGSTDSLLSFRMFIKWASISIPFSIIFASFCYLLVGPEYQGDRLTFAVGTVFMVLAVSSFSLLFLKKDKVKDGRAWKEFATVNKLEYSEFIDPPEVLRRASGVDTYNSGAVKLGDYSINVVRAQIGILGDKSAVGGDSFDRRHYTVAHFQLDGNLPHIFINNSKNDPYRSFLGGSNIEDIYGLQSFRNQHTSKKDTNIQNASIFSSKHDIQEVKKVLDKLSVIDDMLDTKPYFDIEIHDKNIWLIYNGDNRTPQRLRSVIESANSLTPHLKALNSLTKSEPYTSLKAAPRVY